MRLFSAIVLGSVAISFVTPAGAASITKSPVEVSAQKKQKSEEQLRKERRDRWCKQNVGSFRGDKAFARREAMGCYKP
jgi:hypothetical protein